MSNLYASISSDAAKTQATRRGHKRLSAHVRGWEVGIKVYAQVQPDGSVMLEAWRTGGSNDGSEVEMLARISI